MPPAIPIIEVDGLAVRYDLRLDRQNTLRRRLTGMVTGSGERREFWALRGVSFRVRRGDCLGVIGVNGAGKSTLLQVLAGILDPSVGRVRVDGRVSTLLTLGAGFDPDLSGRDNVFLSGAFMGISRQEMQARLPGIKEFAGLGDFIDAPVRMYSSGMRARLGFSIASAVEPDVLLVDEVLSTGDAGFRARSKERVRELVRRAGAVVLVTHDTNWVLEFCSHALLLDGGVMIASGGPADVVRIYRDRVAASPRAAA
jgi:ABC-type polysaccharide/polyol phosphate transport system ATPase subunit